MDAVGISQAQLADRAGVSRSGLSEVLNKNRLPGCDFLLKIAVALGISTDYLLGVESDSLLEGLSKETSTKRLLAAFEALNPVGRDQALSIIEELAKNDGLI
jgi:transcriptional regulator with XRE-family HTH domain